MVVFLKNAIVFTTFCEKFGPNLKTWEFAKKKLLVLARLTRLGGFSQNAIVFATFC